MDRELFEQLYQAQAPWDIGRPQPAFVALAEAGAIRGSVLDAGCGSGDNAICLAKRGHEVWGIDFVAEVIERARARAAEQGADVHFEVADALALDRLGRSFDTVIDCGLFHTFDDAQRARYVAGLRGAIHPGGHLHFLGFSEHEPPGEGPRRLTKEEIRAAFPSEDGWRIEAIRDSRFETADYPGGPRFSPGGPRAYLVTVARAAADERTGERWPVGPGREPAGP
jgi:SAM-dependent methyltransferase